MELYSDAYYVKRIQDGDDECFACLLDKYSQQVFGLIHRIVASREDAEELTQDVFLKVYRSILGFREDSKFSTWLYRIAYNTAISATRKKKREYTSMEEGTLENISDESVDELFNRMSNQGRYELLYQSIERLQTEEQAMIQLFYMEDKSMEDLSEIFDITVSNAKTKLFRIRKKLYVILNEMRKKDETYE